jgi:hypothetical protein
MANTFLTPDEIAMEALVLVQSNMVASRLMDRSYEGEIRDGKVGEQIRVRRRRNGTVNEWSPGGPLTVNDRVESSILVTLEKHFDVSERVTSRERQFKLRNFSSQVLAPMMLALAERIDSYALSKLHDLPEVGGPSELAPGALPNSTATLAQVRRKLNDLRVPMSPRFQIASPEYEQQLLSAPEFTKVNESGSSDALREARLNRLLGLETFMDQNVDDSTFTTGTQTSIVVNGALAIGATSIVYDGGAVAAGTIKAGDILIIAGYGNAVASALSTATAGAGTVTIKEPLRDPVADDVAITVYDGGGTTYQRHGAAFHPRAFAFVAPALAPHENAAESAVRVDPDTGLGLRVTFDYDRDHKADVMSIDCLVGVHMVDGRLGAQIIKNI